MTLRRRSISCAAILVAMLGTLGAVVGVASSTSDEPASVQAWAVLDGFEDDSWPDPGLWTLPSGTAPTWQPSSCQAKHGARSLRAFSGQQGAPAPACDAEVEEGSVSRITMRLDLTETALASRLDLFFELWLKMPAGDDQGLFIYLLVPQDVDPPIRIPIFGGTGMGGLWAYPRMLDLMNLENIEAPDQPIDLRGGVWDLEWVAYVPRGAPAGGGVFIDSVSLVWEPDPAVPTPTRRSTATPTNTEQPTDEPTPTPRPTTATPTPEPDRRLFLPLLGFSVPETPTPTASETPELTVSPDTTPADTPGTTPEATPGATATTSPATTSVSTPGTTPELTSTRAATGTATRGASSTATGTATSAVTSTPTATFGPLDWHIYLPCVNIHAEPEP